MPKEIHLGDVGTLYKVRSQDENGDFDPSTATTKQLIFKFADGTVVVKTATIVGGPAPWYLTYTAEAGFHTVLGQMELQGFLVFSGGSQWHSDIQTAESNETPLIIHPNLN